MNNTTGNAFGDEFRNASRGAGNLSAADASSLIDDRTRVSDASISRVETGYRNMDKILANDKLTRGKQPSLLYKLHYIYFQR
jgi:hypothetical protein